MRVLVCGGREFNDAAFVNSVLDRIHERVGITVLIEGEQRGADTLGKRWAICAGVEIDPYPADFDRLGPVAGRVRNARMLAQGRPDLVVAFPGNKGTRHMVGIALAAGVRVVRPNYKDGHGASRQDGRL